MRDTQREHDSRSGPHSGPMRRRAALRLLVSIAAVPVICGAGLPPRLDSQSTPASGSESVSISLPRFEGSVKFLVMGDSGSGSRRQFELADKMVAARAQFPFEFAVMLGDNLYGRESPSAYVDRFERPYKGLLDEGVEFFASLGNHDSPNQRMYKRFNMEGHRYYSFSRGPVEFFVMDSTYMDRVQLAWLERELDGSRARWKIAYGHHPLYSSGERHGSELDLRTLVEPLFVKFGVDVVLAGHEHFYERINPQQGIYYFTSGAAGKLRKGNIRRGGLTAAGYDQDLSFMLMEIEGDELHFQVIARSGATVDSGVVARPADPPRPSPSS
jgi:predicted phosphodiesterase